MVSIADSNKKNGEARLLGVPIGSGTLADITRRSLAAIDGQAPQATFACANPHSLVVSQQDTAFLAALRATTLVVADGVGVSLVAGLCHVNVGPRITGHCYFESVLNALAARGHGRVMFFGSTDDVLVRIAARFARDYPQLTLCGVLSPPFGDWSDAENTAMIDRINEARPDVLWVGMTAPKQEKWVHANAAALKVPVIGSIGAVFDYFAGTYPRAPDWMRSLGLEWAYRLINEPRRMWRRTFVSAPRFVGLVLASRLRPQG